MNNDPNQAVPSQQPVINDVTAPQAFAQPAQPAAPAFAIAAAPVAVEEPKQQFSSLAAYKPLVTPKKSSRTVRFRVVGVALLVVGALTTGMLAFFNSRNATSPDTSAENSQRIKVQTVGLTDVVDRLQSASQEVNQLTVNGQVNVANSLVLQPSSKPASLLTGQLFYDKTQNQLGYYNGSDVVYLQGAGGSGAGAGSSAGSGGVSLTATSGTIPLVSGAGSLGNSILRQQGSSLSVAGSVNIQGQYQANGSQISSANLSNDSNIAKLSGDQTFLGVNVFKNSATALQVQNASGANLFSIDGANNAIVLGQDGAMPTATTIRGGAAAGNNINGANLVLQASNGTGTGGSGDIILQTASGLDNPKVTVDASYGAEGDNSHDMTWMHTVGSHADRLLIVSVDISRVPDPGTVANVTFDGVPLTKMVSLGGDEANGSVWYLVAPPLGAHQVRVSFAGLLSAVCGESTTFYNVDQFDAIGGFASQTDQIVNHISTTLAGTNGGQGAYDIAMARADWAFPTPLSDQTMIFTQVASGRHGGSFRQADAGNTTMGWTGSGGSTINHVVVAINPEPNVHPDPLVERLRVTQSGTVGINLSYVENASSTISFGGGKDSTIGVNRNPTSGNGHNLTIAAGGGANGGDNNGGDLVLQGGVANAAGIGGSVIVKPQTDSLAAFKVQNAGATDTVLSVDTANSKVTVTNLVVTADLYVNGHIVTGGSTPTAVGGVAACTSPTVTVSGTDTSGVITVTTGTGCASAGEVANITFAAAFAAAPHVTLTPGSQSAAGLNAYIDNSATTTTGFRIGVPNALTGTTMYQWNYLAVQ